MLAVLIAAYFAFSVPGLIDASGYNCEQIVKRMSQLEEKVDQVLSRGRLNEKSSFQWRLSRQVKILESRIAEMMLQQTRSKHKHEVLQDRIIQLEKQVKNNERTIENRQSEIESIKYESQRKLDLTNQFDRQRQREKQRNDGEIKQNSSKQGLNTNDRLTNKGRIIKRSFPEVPFAFTAILDHNVEHSGIDQTVIFNKVLLNDGNAYNNKTGVFTVQQEGVYMFYLAFGAGYEPHKVWMHIVVDGHGQVSGVADTLQPGHDAQGTNLVLLHLQKGDSVWVTTYAVADVKIYGATSFTTFSGILLYEY